MTEATKNDADDDAEDDEDDDENNEELKKEAEANSMKNLVRLWKMNTPEWPFLLLGAFGALIVGGTQPGKFDNILFVRFLRLSACPD